jgi:enoyl-CoA hydratase/carnithine racemase
MSIDLRRDGAVFVLSMNDGENRLNRTFLTAFNAALDEVEASTGPAALVTVGGDVKFYSNGLDLTWMGGPGQSETATFLTDVHRLFGRLLRLSVPSVAAINGHAFAAGAMLALAHDFRIMRADRGFFCLPEVDINLPLSPGMTALIQTKLDAATCADLILTGRRVGGTGAAALRIVDEATSAEELLSRAMARAEKLATKERGIYGTLKGGLYGPAATILGA